MTYMQDARTGVWSIKIFPNKAAMDDFNDLDEVGVRLSDDNLSIVMREYQDGDRKFNIRRPEEGNGHPHVFIHVYSSAFSFDIKQRIQGGAPCYAHHTKDGWEFRIVKGIQYTPTAKVVELKGATR
jgi:hypothetical protein